MTPTSTVRAARVLRTFVVGTRNDSPIVHDPLTGLTHRARTGLAAGRVHQDAAVVTSWPVVHPGDVHASFPISVCWSPLVRCNLACPHCLDDKAVAELGRVERNRVAHLLAESPILGVDISGGEPLLLRELPDLIDVLAAGGCAVSVTTNGTHLARRAEALATRVDAVRVSLDGPTPEHHDRWRGAGSFDRAIAGIRAAVAHGIPTQIQTVFMRSTAQITARPMVELAAKLGVHGVTVLQMLPIGEGSALADTELLTDDEARSVLAEAAVGSPVLVRLRTREAAGGFTVIRANGQVWRNHPGAEAIGTLRPLHRISDLALTERDGSA